MTPPAVARARNPVRAAQAALESAYRLDLEVEACQHLVTPEEARRLLPGRSPRSGLVMIEEDDVLWLGLYLDPADVADPDSVVEETSHFVCVAWHVAQARPVSPLVLELQSEIDRYVLARLAGREALAHFERFRWDGWMDAPERARYQQAHEAGHQYCRALERRYPRRRDVPALLSELRSFYRAPSQAKLRLAATA